MGNRSENLQYAPPALHGRLQLDYCRRNLSRREGVVLYLDPHGNYLRHNVDISVVEANELVQAFIEENPKHKAIVWEHCCGYSGDPFAGQNPQDVINKLIEGGE